MTPTFTYEYAVLLSHISPKEDQTALCAGYKCNTCPAFPNSIITDYNNCPFITPYGCDYSSAALRVRSDMRAQFPPEQYPELYI